MSSLQAWVHTLRHEAQDIISVELHPMPGESLPAFEPGAHIDLHLPGGLVRSYSLVNDSRERHRYLLGVLKDKASRGGSRCVHEQLRVGTVLTISAPRNHFPLHEDASHSVLIAGGIGITPILSMARRLQALGRSFEVMYLARSRASAAFSADLTTLACPVHWHFDDEAGGPPDLRALLAARAPQGHVHHYACGPAVMLNVFEQSCAELGHANAHTIELCSGCVLQDFIQQRNDRLSTFKAEALLAYVLGLEEGFEGFCFVELAQDAHLLIVARLFVGALDLFLDPDRKSVV